MSKPRHAPPSTGDQPRPVRMELRLAAADQALIEEAARLCGDDPAAFARRSAVLAARRLIARYGDTQHDRR